ncbi:MAG: hypothetical protein HC905_20025 [Bacteroidales bacterium]|nr:hypothetical protein [Bacteroidales bacterium]
MNTLDTNEFILDTLDISGGPNIADCNFLGSQYYATNWKDYKLRVTYLCAKSGTSNTCLTTPHSYAFLPKDIELEAVMEVTRVVRMPNSNSGITSISRGTSEVLGIENQLGLPNNCWNLNEYIKWTEITWALEYEVEWVYIPDGLYVPSQSDYFNNYAGSLSDYQQAFELSEPVRITTPYNYYPMPWEYPKDGKIYIRVRPLGRLINAPLQDYDQPAFYPWFYTVTLVQESTTFNDDRNWQRVTTFAEEGKFKKVISYYDGLNRSRQSLTHISSDHSVIIAETLYDHEGRGVVQTMPYPEECVQLEYKPDRHRDNNDQEWNKYDFELEANNSNNDNEKLNVSTGAPGIILPTTPFWPWANIMTRIFTPLMPTSTPIPGYNT